MKMHRLWKLSIIFGLGILILSLCAIRVIAQPISVEVTEPTGPGLTAEFDPTIPVSDPLFPIPNLVSSIGTIEGPDFDTNGTNNGAYYIPPDPIGAAGPNHVVCVVNCTIQWHTKSGTEKYSKGLEIFFASLLPATSARLFDPKVIYDQHDGRFVVVTLERDMVSLPQTSRILLAVSSTDDPNDPWYFHAINSRISNNWADYPGLAVDEEAVYITCNLFRFSGGDFSGQRLWIVDKDYFYTGGTVAVTVHNPWSTVKYSDYAGTTQPAHIFGAAPTGVGTWLVQYSGLYDTSSNVLLGIIRVDDPLGSPEFDLQFVNFGTTSTVDDLLASMPDAPQLDSSTDIETNDRRALHAVWRNDSLWMTTTVVPPTGADDEGQATARWVEVNTATPGALTLADTGSVGGEDIDADTHTFFPSIAVNSDDSIGIGFAASGENIYPGAYYTGRCSTDTAGTVQASQVLAEGLASYVRIFPQAGGDRNRWGDYSGICVDPSDDTTFWAFNEYAITRGTLLGGESEDGRWGTRWGEFTVTCQSEITLDFSAPWTLISCPGNPDISSFATIFAVPIAAGIMNPAVFAWNRDTQKFEIATTCEFGRGYWVQTKVNESFSVTIEYEPRCTMIRTLKPYWELMGSVAESVPWASRIEAPSGVVSPTLHGWDAGNQEFVTATNVEPGHGYYVNQDDDATLTIECASVSAFPETQFQPVVDTKKAWESLLSVKAGNDHRELTFGVHPSASADFDVLLDIPIPPSPSTSSGKNGNKKPKGILKAGWVTEIPELPLLSASYVSDTGLLTWKLLVDLAQPGKLSFTGLPDGYDCVLREDEKEEKVKKNGKVNLSAGEHLITLQLVEADGLPKATQVLANYPNPFNPETWIPYTLEEDSDVLLIIRDISGREVRRFHLGVQPAGEYLNKSRAIYWDGRNKVGETVSSGVYFYSLQANGEVSQTRKLVIIR